MLLPRSLRGWADKDLQRAFKWLRKHATEDRPPYAWHQAILVSHKDPNKLPDQMDRLASSEAQQFFLPMRQIHTDETAMPKPPTLRS